eukprot:m51a1_g11152 putative basic-leucine zipper transcription factor (587) ;mRNA; r:249949-251979
MADFGDAMDLFDTAGASASVVPPDPYDSAMALLSPKQEPQLYDDSASLFAHVQQPLLHQSSSGSGLLIPASLLSSSLHDAPAQPPQPPQPSSSSLSSAAPQATMDPSAQLDGDTPDSTVASSPADEAVSTSGGLPSPVQPAQQPALASAAARRGAGDKGAGGPAEILPTGVLLPAVLGGPMPAPSRKRKRKHNPDSDGEDSDDPSRLAIRLPRETLLSLTSAQMSKYVRFIRETHKLTPGQQKELKQQKRLVKNRESARLSRQRKQDHISTLEGQISELRNEMEALRGQNQALLAENQRVMQAMQAMQAMRLGAGPAPGSAAAAVSLRSSGSGAQLQPRLGQGAAQAQQSFGDPEVPAVPRLPSDQRYSEILPSRTLRAAGVCIFIIMFSFGLFFRASQDMDSGVVIRREVVGASAAAAQRAGHVTRILDPAAAAPASRGGARMPKGLDEGPGGPQAQAAADVLAGLWDAKPVSEWRPQDVTYVVARDATRVDAPCGDGGCAGAARGAAGARVAVLVPLRMVSNVSEDRGSFVEILCRVDDVRVVTREAIEAAAALGAAGAAGEPPQKAQEGEEQQQQRVVLEQAQ